MKLCFFIRSGSKCVYIEMGPNVDKMIASKELSVFIHLPRLAAAPSIAKPLSAKKSTTADRYKETGTKRNTADENSSKQANVKKPKVIDLAESDSDDELSVTETALAPSAVKHATADILWDEDTSEDEFEFAG